MIYSIVEGLIRLAIYKLYFTGPTVISQTLNNFGYPMRGQHCCYLRFLTQGCKAARIHGVHLGSNGYNPMHFNAFNALKCIATRWNRKSALKSGTILFRGKGRCTKPPCFYCVFEGWALSSNPSFSAHEKQSDGCFFCSRESGFEAALGSFIF